MKMLKTALCLSVPAFILCMGSSNAAAYDTSPDKHTLHIHTPELKSAPSYQLASITWLPDYDANEKVWGKYIIKTGGNGGGHDRGDGCDSKFNLSECPANGDCDDCPTNQNKIYFKGCKSDYKAEPAGSQNCVLDCVPNECKGYDLKEKSDANAEYESCELGCNLADKYKFIKCKQGYFPESNKCVKCTKTQPEGSCLDGTRFNESTSCENAEGVKVGDCEDCLQTDCKGFVLCGEDDVTEGASCKCGNKTYYKGCKPCDKTQTSCSTGQTLVNICKKKNGNTYGDCVDCRDENSPYNPCKGFHLCGEDTIPDGETCDCGGLTYAEHCLVQETCLYQYRPSTAEENCVSGIWDRKGNQCYSKLGTIPARNKCTSNIDGKTYYSDVFLCTTASDSIDLPHCEGYKSPYDCSKAGNGAFIGGDTCECGGVVHGKYCLVECNYEETPESCKAQGKEFLFHCAGEDGIQHGECL